MALPGPEPFCWRRTLRSQPRSSAAAARNVAGAVERRRLHSLAGFAAAAQASEADDLSSIAALRDTAERAAQACGAVVCGDPSRRLPNTTCLALPGVAAGVQVIALDLEGIAVSAGAACSSGKVQTSHVLQAMNLGPLAEQAIRVSLPWNITPSRYRRLRRPPTSAWLLGCDPDWSRTRREPNFLP